MAENIQWDLLQVKDLKKIIRDRGISTKLNKKKDLLDLAQKSVINYDVIEECDHLESERKRRRVTSDNGIVLYDFNGKEVHYNEEFKSMPPIHLSDVFAYLTTQCGWTFSRLKNHKQDDAVLMCKAKHVSKVMLGKVQNPEYCFIRAKVKPEQRQTAESYDTWILTRTLTMLIKMTKNSSIC